jgi:hypothetical protein
MIVFNVCGQVLHRSYDGLDQGKRKRKTNEIKVQGGKEHADGKQEEGECLMD